MAAGGAPTEQDQVSRLKLTYVNMKKSGSGNQDNPANNATESIQLIFDSSQEAPKWITSLQYIKDRLQYTHFVERFTDVEDTGGFVQQTPSTSVPKVGDQTQYGGPEDEKLRMMAAGGGIGQQLRSLATVRTKRGVGATTQGGKPTASLLDRK